MATQAERDSYKFLQQQTAARVAQSCAGELEREVDEILGPIGVPSDLSRQVANTLQREETLALEAEGVSMDVDSQVILESGQPLPQLKFQSTVGLTPFLLQFGQGVEPVPKSRMYSSAATIGVGYLVGGAIPLLPYFFICEYLITVWLLDIDINLRGVISFSHCLTSTLRVMHSHTFGPDCIRNPQGPYHGSCYW